MVLCIKLRKKTLVEQYCTIQYKSVIYLGKKSYIPLKLFRHKRLMLKLVQVQAVYGQDISGLLFIHIFPFFLPILYGLESNSFDKNAISAQLS